MGVYIKGMEMPPNCSECAFCGYYGNKTHLCDINQQEIDYEAMLENRRDDCPLIPVPEHGRLGDLEQAVIILDRTRDHCGNEDMAFALNWAANSVRGLPTIIPEDKEVDDDNG